jgi:hypothetical protein
MGIPLDIFSLYLLRREDEGCRHHLLLRVEQPEFSNADEGDYGRAVEAAERKRRALIEAYEAGPLAGVCGGPHTAALVGELQSQPAGDELFEGRGGFDVDLWVAETRFGRPWVALGAAESEEEFWRAVERDENLSALGAVGPARKVRAYFVDERGAI